MKPLISVIVPVYNVEKYLEKCISSILMQTLSDFELILVDDGSKDSSLVICNSFAAIDKRIIVIHKVNGGVSSSRNAGLAKASGDYIIFVDSDDWVREDMFHILYENLIHYDADISMCDLVKTKKEEVAMVSEKNMCVQEYDNLSILKNLNEKYSIAYNVLWNKLYKKELWRDIRFPEGKIHEDEFVIHRIYYFAKKIIRTNQKLYFYRRHRESIMGKKFNLSRLDKLEALTERAEFYREKNRKILYQEELKYVLKYNRLLYKQVEDHKKDNKSVLKNLRMQYRKELVNLIRTKYVKMDIVNDIIFAIYPNSYRNERHS